VGSALAGVTGGVLLSYRQREVGNFTVAGILPRRVGCAPLPGQAARLENMWDLCDVRESMNYERGGANATSKRAQRRRSRRP
jgi:hypothetical protein